LKAELCDESLCDQVTGREVSSAGREHKLHAEVQDVVLSTKKAVAVLGWKRHEVVMLGAEVIEQCLQEARGRNLEAAPVTVAGGAFCFAGQGEQGLVAQQEAARGVTYIMTSGHRVDRHECR